MRYDNHDLLDAGQERMGDHGFTVRQYQKEILTILQEIDRICKKNNIIYFIMYGSLIGAVRHRGFIPWDDDADVIMTRENFNKFKKACETELDETYDFLHYLDGDNGSAYTFSRIRNKNTTYIIKSEITRHGRNAGFYVDVMTLDYLSENQLYRKLQERCLLGLHRLVSPGFSQGKQHLTAVEDLFLAVLKTVVGRKQAILLMERILSSVPREKASYVISNYLIQSRMSMHIYPKEHFEKGQYVPFEDTMLNIPDQAMTLLHLMYCKSYLSRHINFDHSYVNENETIRDHKLNRYHDILFIPKERSRETHMEVVFDETTPSSWYDEYYFQFINKKENDRCARKERQCQEKAAKYLDIMAKNSKIAVLCCKERQMKKELKDFLTLYDEAVRNENLKPMVDMVNRVSDLKAWSQENLTEEELVLCIRACLMGGYVAYGYRLLKRKGNRYPQDSTNSQKELERFCQDLLEAHYGITEENEAEIRKFTEHYDSQSGGLYWWFCQGVMAYRENRTGEAETIFQKCISADEDSYWANYYLGLLNAEKNLEEAIKYLKAAVNATTFMPLIEKAIQEINRLTGRNGSYDHKDLLSGIKKQSSI